MRLAFGQTHGTKNQPARQLRSLADSPSRSQSIQTRSYGPRYSSTPGGAKSSTFIRGSYSRLSGLLLR
jgi:hypothetical protein